MKGFGREGVNGQREGHFWGLQYFYKNAALSWNPNISFFLDQRLVTMSMKPGQWADSGTRGQKQGAALQSQVSTSLTLCGRERGVTWSKGNRRWLRNTSSTEPTLYPGEPSRGLPMTRYARTVLSNFRPLGLLGGNVLNYERDFVIEMSITSLQITSPLGSKIYVEVISWKTCSPHPREVSRDHLCNLRKDRWFLHKPISKMPQGCPLHTADYLSSTGAHWGKRRRGSKPHA